MTEIPSAGTPPDLSVIVVTRDTCSTLKPIIQCLSEDAAAKRIELLIVLPQDATRRIGKRHQEAFHSVVFVRADNIENRGYAAASAVRRASAAIVALTENHCFPAPGWAYAIVAAHRRGHAAVGPVVVNANPETARSRILHSQGYGAYGGTLPHGPREELPLHNSSYDKAALLIYDNDLEFLLSDERRLHIEMRKAGRMLWVDPTARKAHLNEATWRLAVGLSFCSGWRYGGVRSGNWPVWKRAVYSALWPALSLPITRNLLSKAERRVPADIGVAAVLALTHAFGECFGYIFGARQRYPFVEDDEYLITERLTAVAPRDPRIARYLALYTPFSSRASR